MYLVGVLDLNNRDWDNIPELGCWPWPVYELYREVSLLVEVTGSISFVFLCFPLYLSLALKTSLLRIRVGVRGS